MKCRSPFSQQHASDPCSYDGPAPSKVRSTNRARAGFAVALVGLLAGCGATNGGGDTVAERSVDAAETSLVTLSGQEGPGRGMAWVVLGSDTVLVEVASTAEERRTGLMYRDEVADGTGMLFVFPDERPRSFWMANTYVALDIAFIDSGSRIVDIRQMEPETTDLTESDAPAMFALEVRQGWLEENGVSIGLQTEIIFGPR